MLALQTLSSGSHQRGGTVWRHFWLEKLGGRHLVGEAGGAAKQLAMYRRTPTKEGLSTPNSGSTEAEKPCWAAICVLVQQLELTQPMSLLLGLFPLWFPPGFLQPHGSVLQSLPISPTSTQRACLHSVLGFILTPVPALTYPWTHWPPPLNCTWTSPLGHHQHIPNSAYPKRSSWAFLKTPAPPTHLCEWSFALPSCSGE